MQCKTAMVAQLLTASDEDGFGPIRPLRSTLENPRDMLSFEALISQKSAQIRRAGARAEQVSLGKAFNEFGYQLFRSDDETRCPWSGPRICLR